LTFYGLAEINGNQAKQTEVFAAVAIAENLLDAQILAYKLADKINLPSKYYEQNIGDAGMIV
jgi:phosphoribosylamine-glycine ligase